MKKYFLGVLLFSLAVLAAGANDSTIISKGKMRPDADNAGLKLPPGFGALSVADSVGKARHIVTTAQGAIYVKLDRLREGKGILRLKDVNGDGKIDEVKSFGDYRGTGITIKNDYLYASSNDEVFRYKLDKNGEVINPDAPEKNYQGIGEREATQH